MILTLCPKSSISVVPLVPNFHRTTPSVKLIKPNHHRSETYLIPPTIYGRRQLIMAVRICSTSILNDAGRGGLRMGGGWDGRDGGYQDGRLECLGRGGYRLWDSGVRFWGFHLASVQAEIISASPGPRFGSKIVLNGNL